jgi:1-deoxy-D-xylulose-5-phosphate reductoisomerase
MKKKIAILGSTGSIGKTLFKILKKNKKNFEITLLTANKNVNELIKQIKIFKLKNVIITDYKKFLYLQKKLHKSKIKIFNNFDAIDSIFIKKRIDYTMSSITGLEGLAPTLKIIKYTRKIAIANKESIVCGWSLIKNKLVEFNTQFIPVDSEHFSIFSLLDTSKSHNIKNIYITASGGPFFRLPLNKFKSIKISSALKHPNWKMGKKISIDSATMMNKVFEVIEAKKIFDLKYSQLNILVHPKSYVHAMIQFKNGLTKILIHDTDMVIPIFNSVYEINEKTIESKNLNFSIINNLSFERINLKRFPVVKILNNMQDRHSLFETIIVAANDQLVKMFLNNKIHFLDISKILLRILKNKEFVKYKSIKPKNIAEIIKLSKYVRLKICSIDI